MSKTKYPNDDLFEGTKMTFGEHLEELRGSLVKSMVGLVLGVFVGMYCAGYVIQILQGPLKSSLETYYLEKAETDIPADLLAKYGPEMRETIRRENLAPDRGVRVEPQAILEALQRAAPEKFGELTYSPQLFGADDVRPDMALAFSRLLVQQGTAPAAADAPPSPAARVWRLLPAADQDVIRRLAEAEAAAPAQRAVLAEVLDRLASNPELHRAAEFADLDGWDAELTGQLRTEIARRPSEDKTRRLNKLLLTQAFPDALEPPHVDLVEIPTWKPIDVRVQALGAHEAFMIWLKASFVVGLIVASPWIFWQIWAFVASGLYPHEKRYVYIYLPFSLILFLAGVMLAFFFVFEPVLQFLFSFNKAMQIDPDPRISEWLSFVLILPLGFGVSFQLPLVMLFINRIGIVAVETYIEKWRVAILAIFVISMFLTPADPVSMLLMAVPLTFLYGLGICLCKWMPRGRNPFAEAYEPA